LNINQKVYDIPEQITNDYIYFEKGIPVEKDIIYKEIGENHAQYVKYGIEEFNQMCLERKVVYN
jgi:hypothetical protein